MVSEIFAEDAVLLTAKLVRLDTTNPPGNETPAIGLLEQRLRAAGFETATIPYRAHDDLENPPRSQVVARLRGTGERPGLLFSGHLDVVPTGNVPWSVAPFGGEIQDGRLYGRGSCDMKSGVAALVVAAEAFAASCQERGTLPKGDLVVALTADEERNCLGAEVLVREPLFAGIGAALVAEPTALGLYIAEKGAFWVEITILGRTAHGSMPHLGANAVSAMAEFLHAWEGEYRTDTPVHPLLGTPTLNVGLVRGGVKANVVPDQCIAQLDMRTVPGLTHADLQARIAAQLTAITSRRPGTRFEIKILSDRPSVSCPTDSPLALSLSGAIRDVAGVDPTPRGIPYCTEACIWVPELQIPAVICGPGDPGMAHQPDEFVPTLEVAAAARIYNRVAEELLL